MGRGRTAQVGQTRLSQNGYWYTKVEGHPRAQNGWILTHWLTAEKKLGRFLRDDESVRFVDPKFKRDPYNLAGIEVIKKRTSSLRRRLTIVEERIEELQNERKAIKDRLAKM